jgi:hypothetical protein
MTILATEILGASQSIWIRASHELLRDSGLDDSELKLADVRLDLRCLLEQPGFDGTDLPPGESDLDPFPGLDIFPIDQPFPDENQASSYDWQYRWQSGAAKHIQIIIDEESEFILVPEYGGLSLRDQRTVSDEDRQRFEIAWSAALPVGHLYSDEEKFDADESIVVATAPRNFKAFLDEIHKTPELLRKIDPRRFEELVAELLSEDGFEVKLTPYSKDGGIDIIAARADLVREMYLIQCKRHASRRPVGVDVVRSLYGVVHRERATAGLIVTSSHLTGPAKKECKQLEHQMSFREYDDVVKWISRILKK